MPRIERHGNAPILSLPLELIEGILQHLMPRGSVTPRRSWSDSPLLNPLFLQARTTLYSLSRTCRSLNRAAIGSLYALVILRDRRELVCFFPTLAMIPSRREIVRGFIWVGVLSQPSPRGWDHGLGDSDSLPDSDPRSPDEYQQYRQRVAEAWGCLGEESVDEDTVKAVHEYWQPYHLDWLGSRAEDQQIANLLDLYRDERSLAERFYKATLAMLPRLCLLFTEFGRLDAPFPIRGVASPKSPEAQALQDLLPSTAQDIPEDWTPAPYLRNLKTAVLNATRTKGSRYTPPRLPFTACCYLVHLYGMCISKQ